MRAPVQVHSAADISRPLGFTTEPNTSSRGVATTVTARRSMRRVDQVTAMAMANPISEAVKTPLTSRMA